MITHKEFKTTAGKYLPPFYEIFVQKIPITSKNIFIIFKNVFHQSFFYLSTDFIIFSAHFDTN